MKIILSPAKKMNINTDTLECQGTPMYLEQTKKILLWMRKQTRSELQELWGCNDKIAEENFRHIREMDLNKGLTPAILSYEGIAYQYMAPAVFEDNSFDYVQEHLRMLSGFYGVLKPMDGVTPYRLEMQSRAEIDGFKDLYEFWGSKLYDEVIDDSRIIINLASKEYSKCIEKYLKPGDTYITVAFVEMSKGKLVAKGTYDKMARGEMVRYMAEKQIKDPVDIKEFDRLGYSYRGDLSSDTDYVFERIS